MTGAPDMPDLAPFRPKLRGDVEGDLFLVSQNFGTYWAVVCALPLADLRRALAPAPKPAAFAGAGAAGALSPAPKGECP